MIRYRAFSFVAVLLCLLLGSLEIGLCASVAYHYDRQNRLVSVLYPDGSRIAYTYDFAGNRTSQVVGNCYQSAGIKGDLDADCVLTLRDAIISLQIITGLAPADLRMGFATSGAEVNGNGSVDLSEALYILRNLF